MKAFNTPRLLYLVSLSFGITCQAQIDVSVNEVELAERLAALGCKVELALAGGKIVVDSVRVSGRISADTLKVETLPTEVFKHLTALPRLRKLHLDVNGGEVDRFSMKALSVLYGLKELELVGQDVRDEIMPNVRSLTNLAILKLENSRVTGEGLKWLSELKVLKSLELGTISRIDRKGIDYLTNLHGLRSMRIDCHVDEGAIASLAANSELQTVSIGGLDVGRTLAELVMAPTLDSVEITQSEIDGYAAGRLRSLKHLRVLQLTCCTVTPEALTILRTLKLRRLECVFIDGHVLRELIGAFSECRGELRIAK